MAQPIKKAVLPVAGLGTRVLPATKALPKEMLPVYDRPAIQYVVDEAKAAGIEHFIFVTGRNKGAIEDYFDRAYELEDSLEKKGKTALLEELHRLQPEAGACSFVRQQLPKGLGHAVACARDVVGNEPFAVLLPDMIMHDETPCLAQMVEAYNKVGGNIISVEQVPNEDVSKYGIVDPAEEQDGLIKMKGMVEKPAQADAPSNYMISGRYILQPEIFTFLESQTPGAGGEIQLTDSMLTLMKDSPFYAMPFKGKTYDTGSKQGYLEAFVAMAMVNGLDGQRSRNLLKGLLQDR